MDEVSRSHTIRYTTGRTPPNEWSARGRVHYQNNRRKSMPSKGFAPAIPAIGWPQTYYAIDHTAAGIVTEFNRWKLIQSKEDPQFLYSKGKGKGKAVPLQARRRPEGSKKLRFPDFVTTAQDGGRLSALRTGRLYPPGNTPGTHVC